MSQSNKKRNSRHSIEKSSQKRAHTKNMRHSHQKALWLTFYGIVLVVVSALILLKTFVLTDVQKKVTRSSAYDMPIKKKETVSSAKSHDVPVTKTDTTYKDENIDIKVTSTVLDNTTAWIADVQLKNPKLLKTFLAGGSYGRNITDSMSNMVKQSSAIFAINGDFYGFRDQGYVIRNGVLYRSTPASGVQGLAQNADGNLSAFNPSQTPAQALVKQGTLNAWNFGPVLVENSQVAVKENQEVAYGSYAANPRTGIGQIGKNHYIFIVADGRTKQSHGLSLYQLATLFEQYHATFAYNLDGGGSSEMMLNGKIINKDIQVIVTGKERAISDMIYIGYQTQGG